MKGLALYEADGTLCRRWEELERAWLAAFPRMNVLHEVRKAHAWELANVGNRKKDRPRFLNLWLQRVSDKARFEVEQERKYAYQEPVKRIEPRPPSDLTPIKDILAEYKKKRLGREPGSEGDEQPR